jgi:hypothetical protein
MSALTTTARPAAVLRHPVRVMLYDSVMAREARAVKPVAVGVSATLDFVLTHALCGAVARSLLVVLIDGQSVPPSDNPRVSPGQEVRVAPRPGTGVDLVLFAVAMIASYAASQFMASRVGSIQGSGTPAEQRATFAALSNDAVAGDPIPVVLGTHRRWGGKVIARVPGEAPDGSGRDTLRLLVCLGHGPFARIGNQTSDFNGLAIADVGGIEINEQPGINFADIRVWGRMGNTGQEPIPGFDDIELTREVGAGGVDLRNTSGSDRTAPTASGEAFSFVTVNAVDRVVLRVRLTDGLFRIDGDAQVEPAGVAYRYRWKPVGGSYGAWTIVSLEAATQSPFWSSPRVDVRDGSGNPQQVEVQLERVSAEPATLDTKNALRWANLVEVTEAEEAYEGLCVVGLELTAGEQLQNEPRVSFDVDGFAACKVWDEISPADDPEFVEQFTRNPAWLALTYLTNPVWGCGATEAPDGTLAAIDFSSFLETAQACDEDVDVLNPLGQVTRTRARFACDIVLSEQRPASEHLRDILSTCFAAPVKTGMVWRSVIDVRRDSPVEVFTDGSIAMEGDGVDAVPAITVTRALTKGGISRPNQVVVQYANVFEADREDTITYPAVGELWLGGANAEFVNAKQVRLVGVKDPDQAAMAAVRLLNMERVRARSIQFQPTHPQLAVLPGERFDIASSLLNWGLASGRVLDQGTTTTVRIDRGVTLAPNVTYRLKIVHLSNVVEVRDVDMPAGTYAKGVPLRLATALANAPLFGAEYVLEQSSPSVAAKPFLCTAIVPEDTEELRWMIEGVEYVDFYDDQPGEVGEVAYSGLVYDLIAPGPLETLRVYERRNPQTNAVQAELAWSQRPEDAANTLSFRVYRRITGTATWVQIPEAVLTRRTAVLDIARADRGYDFRVVAVSARGVALSVYDNRHPTATLALGSTGAPPETTITGVTITRVTGNTYSLTWTAVAGAAGYIVYSGAAPDGSVYDNCRDGFIVARTTTNRLDNLRLPTGVSRFYVRSVAGNGRMSFNQGNASVDNTFAPAGMAVKHTFTADFASGGTNLATVSGARVQSTLTSDAVWTSPEVDTGSETPTQLTIRFATANRAQDPARNAFLPNVPSIEADQWGIVDGSRNVGMIFPPFPDDRHQYVIEVRTKTGGVYGPWQPIAPYALLSGTFRQYQVRITWRRGAAPYRPGVVSLVMVAFA